jgi:hypothetical protein
MRNILTLKIFIVAGFWGMTGLLLPTGGDAKSPTAQPSSVTKAPTCDNSTHPKIMKVTPDSVKPGERITIKGSKFGTKQCFHSVSFGSVGAHEFKYVNDTTVEATVPNLKPGLVPVHVLTGGGSSQFVLLIQSK